ncbi:MAG: glycosyltransferase family 2 protein [Planctomycetota bacterium]
MSDRAVLSIVIPIYNERGLWRTLVDRVRAAPTGSLDKQLILVDDGSTDGTREELVAFQQTIPADDRVLFHPANRGKGAALRTGLGAADGRYVIIQDADLEYDPRDYPALLGPLLAGQADVVYGSRFTHGRPSGMRWRNYLANRGLTILSNCLTGWRLTDMETCYKAFRADVVGSLRLAQDRFDFAPEVTAKLARHGARWRETPIRYQGRSRQEGKKIGLADGLAAIGCILRYGLL